MPGRGRGRGGAQHPQHSAPGGLRRGRSASAASAGDVRLDGLCGTCDADVSDKAIGCDKCDTWFHDSEMCTGLPQDVLKAIERFQGSGIQFICMKCRLEFSSARGNSPSSTTETHLVELINQLFQQFKGLASTVLDLTTQVKTLSSQPRPSQDQSGNPPEPEPPILPAQATQPGRATESAVPSRPPTMEYRKMIREEVRELEEQRKRRFSLVIRGLGASTARDAVQNFEAVSEFLINQKVTLSEVVRIPSETDLYICIQRYTD